MLIVQTAIKANSYFHPPDQQALKHSFTIHHMTKSKDDDRPTRSKTRKLGNKSNRY
jgi:hypothetical protein